MSSFTLTDSHCHLHLLDLQKEGNSLENVIARAKEKDVQYLLCVATELSEMETLKAYAEKDFGIPIYFSVGVHPNNDPGKKFEASELLVFTEHPKLIAIGETGLDYFRSEGDLDWQRERFVMHIDVAKQSNKPLIIHTRAAREDTIALLRAESAADVGGVMHCFTEDWDMAKKALDLGFYISFSGILTFKNATELQEVARKVPLDRILIETDCPWLAPVPHRGEPNEPSFVRYVAGYLADLRSLSIEEIAEVTTQNFLRLFKIT